MKQIKPQNFGDTDALAVSADGRYGVAGGFTGVTRLLDLEGGKVMREFKGFGIVLRLAISPGCRSILAVDSSGNLFLYRVP